MKLFFGGREVACPSTDKFTADTKTFGDPHYGMYKFLHIVDSNTLTRVIVSEGNTVESLVNAFVHIPNSQKFEALENLGNVGEEFVPAHLTGFVWHKNALQTWGLYTASRSSIIPYESQEKLVDDMSSSMTLQPSFIAIHLFEMDCAAEILASLADRICFSSQRVVLLLQFVSLHDHLHAFREWMVHIKSAAHKWQVIRIQRVDSRYVLVLKCEKQATFHNLADDKERQEVLGITGVKSCPWCGFAFEKDEKCSFMYCGLLENGNFTSLGCGRSFCWTCGKKYCGQHYDPETRQPTTGLKSQHDANCCKQESGFMQDAYCPGGHSSHCPKRW